MCICILVGKWSGWPIGLLRQPGLAPIGLVLDSLLYQQLQDLFEFQAARVDALYAKAVHRLDGGVDVLVDYQVAIDDLKHRVVRIARASNQ